MAQAAETWRREVDSSGRDILKSRSPLRETKFAFIGKQRNVWPLVWLCKALGVSRSRFHAWLNRFPSVKIPQ